MIRVKVRRNNVRKVDHCITTFTRIVHDILAHNIPRSRQIRIAENSKNLKIYRREMEPSEEKIEKELVGVDDEEGLKQVDF